MISGYTPLPVSAGDSAIEYRVAVAAARESGRPNGETLSKAVHVVDWIDDELGDLNFYAICGSNESPRDMIRRYAREVYRRGQSAGLVPSGFLSIFASWGIWWKLILILVEHFISQGGRWESSSR